MQFGVRQVTTCRRYPQRFDPEGNSRARTRQPVGWDKEASCVSRTPLKGGTRAGRRLATEETSSTLAMKK